MLFSTEKCTFRIEKAISKKTGKEYFRAVLVINDKEYMTFDNNLINSVILNNLPEQK